MEDLKIILKREAQEVILETSIPVDQETITKMAQQTICSEVYSCAPLAYMVAGRSRVWLVTIPLNDITEKTLLSQREGDAPQEE